MVPVDVESPLLEEDVRGGFSEVMPELRNLLEVASCSEDHPAKQVKVCIGT